MTSELEHFAQLCGHPAAYLHKLACEVSALRESSVRLVQQPKVSKGLTDAAAYFYYADVAAILLAMKQVSAQQICEFL